MARDGRGIFAKRNDIIDVNPPDQFSSNDNNYSIDTGKAITPDIGDCVELHDGKIGIIRYIGQVRFNSWYQVYGIELKEFDIMAHDGKGYFVTRGGHGYAIFKTVKDIKK